MSFADGLVGITLDGRYRLDAVLGEGGMGAVFRATHLAMERKVAVKLLKPHLINDETQLARFAREARSTLKVESPHAVKVLDFGVTPHRDYYMVLEYLDGRTVQRELEIDGAFQPSRVVHIARHALHALGAAHRSGFVHRDIKPDNLLLMRVGTDADYTKVLDFGVAKLMEGAASDPSQLALTQAGMVFGTPEFMSPEQACGHTLDGRSDLYSLAATMFVMLTAKPLFEANSALVWLTHHARTPAPRLSSVRPDLAEHHALEELLERCLAKHRDRRPATAEDLDRELAAVEASLGRPTPVPRPRSDGYSASAYMHALPSEMVDAGATLIPEAEITLVPPTTTAILKTVRSRRGLGLVIAACAAVGVIVTALVLGASRSTTPVPDVAPVGTDAGTATALDATHSDASPVDAGPMLDARSAVDAGAIRVIRTNPAAETHLRLAEEARRGDQLLKQMTEADLALKADPRNVRAKFLYGEALVKYGDTTRGCAYLRSIGRKHPACGID